MVARVRRALGTSRIGHAGTLDPFATGLLVLLVGRATRLLAYLDGEPKVYEAAIRFGAETATDDCTGEVVREAPLPSSDAVDTGIHALTGEIEQLPPSYSAKKVEGRRAYKAARRGEAVQLAPVRVTVHSWTIRARKESELAVTITCGGGTYIRALARDLGRLAHSAAHLTSLRRTRSGPFSVDDALPEHDLDRAADALLPLRRAIASMPVQTIDENEIRRVSHGIAIPPRVDGSPVSLVDKDGELVAIGIREDDTLRPKVVLRDA